MKRVEVSVVICTRNRFDHLKRCIKSLLNQSYHLKEIIVVDDASRDNLNVYDFFKNEIFGLRYKLSKVVKGIDFILVKNRENSGVVSSRNTGIKVATGDVVAFLDDDGFAHKDWIKNLARNYNNNMILGVGGPVVEIGRNVKTPNKPLKKLAYIKNGRIVTNYRIKKIQDKAYLPKKYVPFFMGGNMSFRRDALLKVNGGDTNLIGNCYREETDLCFRVAKEGKLLFEPNAVAYHNTAMEGGFREVVKFNLDIFLFYMFRNTTYFFFRHFGLKKALNFTLNSLKRQIQFLCRNKTGLTRDYLKIINKTNSIMSIIAGTVNGFYSWLKNRGGNIDMLSSKPKSMTYFKLFLIGGSVKLIILEKRTNILKNLFGH